MNEMIKAERNKICSRKQTRMLFLAGVVLIVAYFFFFQTHTPISPAKTDTGKSQS